MKSSHMDQLRVHRRNFAILGSILLAAIFMAPKPIQTVPSICHQMSPLFTPATVTTKKDDNKHFDVVLYGATGYTGRLAALYLARMSPKGLRWAIAGRSQSKLDAVLQEVLAHMPEPAEGSPNDVATILADSSDAAAVARMVGSTRVLITTVGPYTRYGSLVVEAAAKGGVHYLDLSGEFFWQEEMTEKWHDVAVQSGAKIVFNSGYDSVPFDLGALVATKSFKDTYSMPPTSLSSVVTQTRGLASGGTLQAVYDMMLGIAKGNFRLGRILDPYLLVPFHDDQTTRGTCKADTDVAGWSFGGLPRYDRSHGKLAIPHFMAWINARVVRRSQAIEGLRNCSYGEGMTLGALADVTLWLAGLWWEGKVSLVDLAPSPSQGPPETVRREGSFRVEVVATGETSSNPTSSSGRRVVEIEFKGDPGYEATSKILVEAALCLTDPACHEGGSGLSDMGQPLLSGGVLTPSTAMGTGLVRRLEAAEGGTFAVFKVLGE